MNEHDLFTEALNRTDPAERAAFLDQSCAGNSELRRRLEELLAGHAESRSPLDRSPVAPAESTATADLQTPIATGEQRPDGATQTLDRPDPNRHHGTGIGVPRGPRGPGSRRAKGSARSSPAGTRWSR